MFFFCWSTYPFEMSHSFRYCNFSKIFLCLYRIDVVSRKIVCTSTRFQFILTKKKCVLMCYCFVQKTVPFRSKLRKTFSLSLHIKNTFTFLKMWNPCSHIDFVFDLKVAVVCKALTKNIRP